MPYGSQLTFVGLNELSRGELCSLEYFSSFEYCYGLVTIVKVWHLQLVDMLVTVFYSFKSQEGTLILSNCKSSPYKIYKRQQIGSPLHLVLALTVMQTLQIK